MTDKTEAMDNLIAQDADLIEICPDDLVRRLFTEADNFKVDREVGMRAMLYRAADRIEAQAAEIERLNKSAECLAESRRLAVKDLAALEGHMMLETGQWRVDYDCAIRDVEHLRERIEALTAALEKFDDLIQYQYSGSREAMSAMTEAAQEGARVLGRGAWEEAGQPWLRTYDEHLKGKPNGD
jgi:hypothetical protein